MEYVLSPDCSIVDVIDRLVADYFKVHTWRYWNNCVLIRPDMATALNKEVAQKNCLLGYIPYPIGMELLKLETPAGPVTIVTRPDLELPIFLGSEEELKDNSFNTSMEEILCA